ncbi:DnaB-like helicase C-terminal domain-containing protein [Clostridium sp. C2-6-12]|uniref:DnaB-like helicase C-terminal domain-containing protein n=1 Tax=Clostridium sp. C2-6-12 TaxID=2698832 RepID=UPI00136C3A34|nr:DnaB-like helicase C-terminal domain-containing protein [Clostridium sp. C2-6-12]
MEDAEISERVINSELYLLGTILGENKYILEAINILKEDDFYRTSHRVIFKTMITLYKKDISFDIQILINNLMEHIQNKVITITEITQIAEHTAYATFESHLNVILECSKQRKLNKICSEIAKSRDSVEMKVSKLQDALMEINSLDSKDNYYSISDVLENAIKKIEKASKSKDGITGISTGIQILDAAINGLEKQSMIVFGARPSMGKTAFSIEVIRNIKCNVLYIQLDMTLEGMAQRMLATDTGISNNRVGKGRLDEKQWENLLNSTAEISQKKNLFFYSPGIATISKIMLKAKEIKVKHGLDCIVIDHIGKITPETKGSKYEQMSTISSSLKNMARKLDICLIALCQLSRAVEQRQDKHPMMSDLRDTGTIEEDADIIGFLYRDGYYKDKTKKNDILEVSFEKNRNGQTGKIEFEYNLVTQELIQQL